VSLRRFSRGTAIRIPATVVDSDGNPVDATCTITITDPEGGVVVNGEAMTKEQAGSYYYIWQTTKAMAAGVYQTEVAAAYGGYTGLVAVHLFRLD